jgi:hypothetical protein
MSAPESGKPMSSTSRERLTRFQRQVLENLRTPGAYLRYETANWWCLDNIYKRVCGVQLRLMVGKRTVNCLARSGHIKPDRGHYFSVSQVGERQ